MHQMSERSRNTSQRTFFLYTLDIAYITPPAWLVYRIYGKKVITPNVPNKFAKQPKLGKNSNYKK